MLKFNLGYRHDNGDVEGFTGFGFTQGGARENAIKQAREKREAIGKTYSLRQLIECKSDATAAEFTQLREHWNMIRQQRKDGGASIY